MGYLLVAVACPDERVRELRASGIASDRVLDLTVSGDEVTEHGSWWRATVYWSEDDA
ncbi:MAG: hypothetical protein QM572_09135 [Nocardioides sp.]|uniref:hypothetical protein n=1 Tax=Nocardioides sp. TaxID=35761 RepID=UPI0039E70A34